MGMSNAETAHVFSHLAAPPYKYLGYDKKLFAVPGEYAKAGASCDHCGTAIADCYRFRGSDGKEFKVGSTCVGKSKDRGLIDLVKREANKVKTAQRRLSEATKIAAFRARLADTRVKVRLGELPHPNVDFATRTGATFAGYVEWILKHAGHAGILKCAKAVEKLCADIPLRDLAAERAEEDVAILEAIETYEETGRIW